MSKVNRDTTTYRNLSQGAVVNVKVKSPNLDFKFLHLMHSKDLEYLHTTQRKHNCRYFPDLEEFIYKFSCFDTLEKAIQEYTSKNGSKISKNKNTYVKNLIKKFKAIDTEDSNKLIGKSNKLRELEHMHLKKGGKGAFVIFGITYESSFYVLDMNPEHDFN